MQVLLCQPYKDIKHPVKFPVSEMSFYFKKCVLRGNKEAAFNEKNILLQLFSME